MPLLGETFQSVKSPVVTGNLVTYPGNMSIFTLTVSLIRTRAWKPVRVYLVRAGVYLVRAGVYLVRAGVYLVRAGVYLVRNFNYHCNRSARNKEI